MAFRFQRRIKIAPGVRLNVSKTGISASAGIPGLTANSRGTVTAGVPGTGLSYRHKLEGQTTSRQSRASKQLSTGSKRIAAGVLLCLLGGVCPVVAWLAIPCFVSGYNARTKNYV